MIADRPLVTVAVPSFNQARYLDAALRSIFDQHLPVEVFVADGGSDDSSVEIIRSWAPRLAGWRSHRDNGQSDAINEAIGQGTAPYVMWLNSDDLLLPGGLATLLDGFTRSPGAGVSYGKAWNLHDMSGRRTPVWVEAFDPRRLARRCIIAQPATLIRRAAWEGVGGLDTSLHMAMDYDLWWRLHLAGQPFAFTGRPVAVNRIHDETKTRRNRRLHYSEAIEVVRRHYGRVPAKWWLAQPYSVLAKTYVPFLP